MPLKHFTETILVVVLGFLTILTGIAVAILPPLPAGLTPWLIVLALTLIYPLALYPMLRVNRADYEFRLLHFAPAFFALLWFLLQVVQLRFASLGVIQSIVSWGLSLPLVLVTFALLVWFCLHVIRRRIPRLTVLGLLLVPFLALSYSVEREGGQTLLGLVRWTEGMFAETGTGTGRSSSGSLIAIQENWGPSSSAAEAEWREKLRDLERASSAPSSVTVKPPVVSQGSVSSKPAHLPSSGPEWGALAIAGLSVYTGTLHRRARNRSRRDA